MFIQVKFGQIIATMIHDLKNYLVGKEYKTIHTPHLFTPFLLLLLFATLGPISSFGQRIDKLVSSQIATSDEMGRSVDIDGDLAVVGIPNSDLLTLDGGAAILFEYRNGEWVEAATLLPPNLTAGDAFGSAVGIHQGRIAVASSRFNGQGAVFMFEKYQGEWSLTSTLNASDAAANDLFGSALAIYEDQLLIAAEADKSAFGFSQGAVYAFSAETVIDSFITEVITETDTVVVLDTIYGPDEIISTITVDTVTGDTIVLNDTIAGEIESILEKEEVIETAVVNYEEAPRTVWTEQTKLFPNVPGFIFEFGNAIDINGNQAIIGDNYNYINGQLGSSAFIYERIDNSWTLQQQLIQPGVQGSDSYGSAVAMGVDEAWVGAYLDDDDGGNAGSVFVYQKDTTNLWVSTQRLSSPDAAAANSFFGIGVDLGSDQGIIGASGRDGQSTDEGAGFLFTKDATSGLWSYAETFLPQNPSGFEQLGSSVALSGTRNLMGAPGDGSNGTNSGAAYILDTDPPLYVDLGADQEVIIGYDPLSCATLRLTDLKPGTNVLWSTGETSASIEVCPSSDMIVSVILSNDKGEFATDSVKICVRDIRCGGVRGDNVNNVNVCFRSYFYPFTQNTYCVPVSLIPTYISLGATLGSCGEASCLEEDETQRRAFDGEVMPGFEIEAFPNPGNGLINIAFAIGFETPMQLEILDLNGRKVAEVFKGNVEGGMIHTFQWDASSTPPGIYVYQVRTPHQIISKKLVISQ